MYRQPGSEVDNEFQLIANPNTGSSIVSCVVGEITDDITAYPTKVAAVLKSQVITSGYVIDANVLVDTFSTASVTPGMSGSALTSDGRLSNILYDMYDYNALRTTPTTLNTNDLTVVTLTHAASGTDSVLSTITFAATGNKSVALPMVNGNAYDNLTVVDQDGNVYHTTADVFTITLSASGAVAKVAVNWTAATSQPAAGKKYFVMVGNIDTTISANQTGIANAQVYFLNYIDSANKQVLWKILWKGEEDTLAETFSFVSAPAGGTTYQIITKVEYPATIKIYTSFSDVAADFGDAILVNGTINSLSFAAYLAFNEGAQYLAIAGYDQTPRDINNNHRTLSQTFDDLLTEDGINIVTILDNTIPTTVADPIKMLANHVLSASSKTTKKYRMAIAGIDVTGQADDVAAYRAAGQFLASSRVLLVGPSKVTFALTPPGSSTLQKYTVGPEYLAVILAAMWGRSESDVATSMTRKESRTIVDLLPRYIDSKLDLIASNGISLFAKVRGRIVMRDDITTNTTDLLGSQPYVTLSSDAVAIAAIEVLDVTVIGMKMLIPATLTLVQQALVSMLEEFQRDNLIQSYSAPIVTVDPTNGLKILVTVRITPMLASKYIDLTFNYTLGQ